MKKMMRIAAVLAYALALGAGAFTSCQKPTDSAADSAKEATKSKEQMAKELKTASKKLNGKTYECVQTKDNGKEGDEKVTSTVTCTLKFASDGTWTFKTSIVDKAADGTETTSVPTSDTGTKYGISGSSIVLWTDDSTEYNLGIGTYDSKKKTLAFGPDDLKLVLNEK